MWRLRWLFQRLSERERMAHQARSGKGQRSGIAIATSHTPLWLASGWGCRDRRPKLNAIA
jgi:hypothetical protein